MNKVAAKEKLVKFWRKDAKPLLIMVLVLFAFRSAIADWMIPGSMKPTIIEGDRVLVNKVAYDLKVPFTVQAAAMGRSQAWRDRGLFLPQGWNSSGKTCGGCSR